MTAMFKGLKTKIAFQNSNLAIYLCYWGEAGSMVRVGGVDACWTFFYWTRNAWFLAVTDFVLTVGGLGDWRTDGCHITGVFRNFTTVHCSHLSIFAIIEVILQIIVSALISQKKIEETYFFLIYDLDLINFEMFIH